jgi:hypothetical protein
MIAALRALAPALIRRGSANAPAPTTKGDAPA